MRDDTPAAQGISSNPDRNLTPMSSRTAVAPTGPIRNRWALLVGVNHYIDRAIPDLRFGVNDVVALDKLLKTRGYFTVMLHDTMSQEDRLPTRDNIEAELARLCRVAGRDDLLWVHFACHGKLVNGKPMLITRETREPTLAEKALPLSVVKRRMQDSKARRLVLTLDCCHTGVEIGRDLADPEFIRNAYELAEGFVLLAASTAQQVAQEWEEGEHGVFTYFLLDGLSGKADRGPKGFVTVDDLRLHVLDGLHRWMVEHGGVVQEPTAYTEGRGDMVLAKLPAVRSPAEPEPVEAKATDEEKQQRKAYLKDLRSGAFSHSSPVEFLSWIANSADDQSFQNAAITGLSKHASDPQAMLGIARRLLNTWGMRTIGHTIRVASRLVDEGGLILLSATLFYDSRFLDDKITAIRTALAGQDKPDVHVIEELAAKAAQAQVEAYRWNLKEAAVWWMDNRYRLEMSDLREGTILGVQFLAEVGDPVVPPQELLPMPTPDEIEKANEYVESRIPGFRDLLWTPL
jgi:hypothetical protein